MMTTDVLRECVGTYRDRRSDLIAKAREADAHRRPIAAAHLRQAARLLLRAIVDEEVNDIPIGLGSFGDLDG